MQSKRKWRSAGEKSKFTPYPQKEVNLTSPVFCVTNRCTSALAHTGHACKFKAHLYNLRREIKNRLKNLFPISRTDRNPLFSGNAFFWWWYQKQKPLVELASLKVVLFDIRLYNASTWSDCSANVKNLINISNG